MMVRLGFLLLGVLVGAWLGIVVMALCFAAKGGDEACQQG